MEKIKTMLNKVPEITLYFWIIKILCTTVGETAADFLNVNLNLGLTGTSIFTGVLLAIVLFFQFKSSKYIPSIYWSAVTLVSVFGTLVTDNLTDKIGLPLEYSTIIFSLLLALTFLIWYLSEKTLSVHSIFTRRREIFYWLTILFTFALGTATGDLVAEGLGVGYLFTGILVATLITIMAIAWKFKLNSILSFWIIYILTRPLGASIGDFLSQPIEHGGLGLGTTITSFIFLGGIISIVTYLTHSKKDIIHAQIQETKNDTNEKNSLIQTIIVISLFIVCGTIGYNMRHSALQTEITDIPKNNNSLNNPLGDLSVFQKISEDTLAKLNAKDQTGATKRISDLEYEWDKADPILKARNKIEWTKIDNKIDIVLRALRAVNPDIASEKIALQDLIQELNAK